MNNLILKESVDYNWLEKDTPFGSIHTFPQLNDGKILKRVTSPNSGSIVMLSGDEELRPVKIISGSYDSNGRISNFWSWYELNEDKSLGQINRGYGYFYESPSTNN